MLARVAALSGLQARAGYFLFALSSTLVSSLASFSKFSIVMATYIAYRWGKLHRFDILAIRAGMAGECFILQHFIYLFCFYSTQLAVVPGVWLHELAKTC